MPLKPKYIFSIIFISAALIYIVIGTNYAHEQGIKDFTDFDTSYIYGPLQKIETAKHGTGFTVNNKEYFLMGLYMLDKKKYEFDEIADIGDTVIKYKNFDELILIHKSDTIFWKFGKIQ